MSYYIGTHNECQQYNELVTFEESYNKERPIIWANLISNADNSLYAVEKHPNHLSTMQEVSALPADWFVNE